MIAGQTGELGASEPVRVRLHPDPVGVQSWVVLTGLAELAHLGEIELSVAVTDVPAGTGMCLEIMNDQVRTLVHFDGQDQGELTAPRRAEAANVVWKRSFRSGSYGRHVVPFGLSLSCVPDHPLPRTAYLRAQFAAGLRGLVRRRTVASTFNSFRKPPFLPLSQFEHEASDGDGSVLFQVKAWSPEQTRAPDVGDINELRAEIIRTARRELGPRFVGGFVPTPFAQATYPDLLTSAPSEQAGFVAQVQRCSVAVGSIGLYGSNPHKLAEYFAAARPVVTEPLSFEIPERLEPGKHLLEYRSASECIEAVTSLIEDDERRAVMRAANTRMWEQHVRPDALVRNRIAEALEPWEAPNS